VEGLVWLRAELREVAEDGPAFGPRRLCQPWALFPSVMIMKEEEHKGKEPKFD